MRTSRVMRQGKGESILNSISVGDPSLVNYKHFKKIESSVNTPTTQKRANQPSGDLKKHVGKIRHN